MTIPHALPQISLDELPKFTNWPKKLLSLEPVDVKYKTEREVLREYQDEKWGGLLQYVRTLSNPTLLDIERTEINSGAPAPCYAEGAFYLATAQQMLDQHLNLYAEVLKPHLKNASCFVELGAGYGSKLLSLSQRDGLSHLPLVAGEYTQSGCDLIAILAGALKKPIAVGHCDFRKMKIGDIRIPEDAVIFTSYAVHYVPELSMDFVGFLSLLKPRAVIHFEPCYEHYDMNSLHGMMCKRYVELNDYTRNLVTVIEAAQKRNKIAVRMRKNVLGSNPFLPISIIEWAPVGRSDILI
jgi:hypothetical protein